MEEIKKNRKLISILKDIKKDGGIGYIVGGYVRDKILGRKSKDIDIEVFNIKGNKLHKILDKYGYSKKVGKSYNIYLFKGIEFSLPQKRKGEKLISSPYMDEKEACRRRDLTINSMMYDPIDDKLVDFFGGKNDIKKKRISYVSRDTFIQDPLRIFRVAQFKARLNFKVTKKTEKVCIEILDKIDKIAKERIFLEIEKILLKAKNPSLAFYWMKRIGLLKKYFPELDNLENIEQGKRYHPEGNVFIHTMMTLDVLPIKDRTIEIMLALLYHDIGKGEVENKKEGNRIHFYGHALKGANIVRQYLKKITNNKDLIKKVEKLIKFHDYPLNMIESVSKKAVRKLASKVDMEDILKVHKADMLGKGGDTKTISHIKEIKKIYNEIKDEVEPIIKGKDLIKYGLKPGPHFGKILDELYEAQLEEKFLTYEDGIKYLRKNYKQK
ncbi:MAG: CCA tRNA nucleotidyltransferase [Fusobacteriota bacterium]